MTPDQKDRAAMLHAQYGAPPGRIASTLGLPIGMVAELFDQTNFLERVKVEQDRIITHALDSLCFVNLPVQEVKRKFADGSHAQRTQLARDICFRLEPYRRWP